MTNYKNYLKIKQLNRKEQKKRLADNLQALESKTTKEDLLASWFFREKTTKRQQESKTLQELKTIIKNKLKQETENKIIKFEKQCNTIAQAPKIDFIYISVEWVKSAIWGHNPHATVTTNNGTTSGRASGCGYDKRTASIAEALNKQNGCLKLIFDKYEKALRKNENATLREAVGYGSGYKTPYFEGGVGYSSFWHIWHNLGAKTNTHHETKTSDFMTIIF